jgi:hypothetical protein
MLNPHFLIQEINAFNKCHVTSENGKEKKNPNLTFQTQAASVV